MIQEEGTASAKATPRCLGRERSPRGSGAPQVGGVTGAGATLSFEFHSPSRALVTHHG